MFPLLMRVYIAIKYEKDKNPEIISELKDIINAAGHIPYAFIEEGYIQEEKEMMKRALQTLNQSDILLVEASNESFGAGIEAGYFFQSGKPIIVVSQEQVKISRTLKGIARNYISYKDLGDLRSKLVEILKGLK